MPNKSSPLCPEKPERLIDVPMGMYHCPYCLTMVLAGVPSTELCLFVQLIDRYFPPCGRCEICGHSDARHRIFDAMCGMASAGDSATSIAENYKVPVEVVKAILET